MAIAKMSRLRIVGLKSDKNKIMNELIKSGAFEAIKSQTDAFADRSRLENALTKRAKVLFAVNYLQGCLNEYTALKAENDAAVKKGEAEPIKQLNIDVPKKDGGRKIIGYDDFYDVAAKEYELMSVCEDISNFSVKRVEFKSESAKAAGKLRSVMPYAGFPLKFAALGDGANVSVMLAYSEGAVIPDFADIPVYTESYQTQKGSLIGIVARVCDKEKVNAALSICGYTLCSFKFDFTATELIEQYQNEENAAKEGDFNALLSALEYLKYMPELKILYDVIGQDIEKATAELDFISTADTFVAEGWVPSDCADKLVERVRKKTERIVVNVSEPEKDDIPPTLVVSKKLIKPYEDVTNMYSVPAYGEIDPNPFMAVFFFVFFGIMIGDAGYGVVLSIVAGLMLRFCKFERGTARLLALVCMGGIAAIVWGALFGSVFTISGIPPLWFNPVDEPLMMLGVSIVLGVIQLLCGYALNSAKSFKEGRPLDAILDSIFIFTLFAGIACMAIKLLIKGSSSLMTAGLVLLFVSLGGILLTAGRHNKGILGKITGGFSGLYGLVNLLSDLLSYARIFGLGLASGAIGMAFNVLGSMFFSIPVVGYVIGIILLIPLHAFNIGIGVLGAYVHNARLQFLEFYGKFYEGGGRPFSPMGENTRFVRFS